MVCTERSSSIKSTHNNIPFKKANKGSPLIGVPFPKFLKVYWIGEQKGLLIVMGKRKEDQIDYFTKCG